MNNVEAKLERIFRLVLKILYYYPFVLAIVSLIAYYFKIDNILFIATILLIIDFVIRFFKGEFKISLILYFACIFLSYKFIINDILNCILLGISFGNIIIIIVNNLIWHFISFMIQKFN